MDCACKSPLIQTHHQSRISKRSLTSVRCGKSFPGWTMMMMVIMTSMILGCIILHRNVCCSLLCSFVRGQPVLLGILHCSADILLLHHIMSFLSPSHRQSTAMVVQAHMDDKQRQAHGHKLTLQGRGCCSVGASGASTCGNWGV